MAAFAFPLPDPAPLPPHEFAARARQLAVQLLGLPPTVREDELAHIKSRSQVVNSTMRLEIHNGLSQPLVVEATRVLVLDDMGNPVAFALTYHKDPQSGREHIRVCDALDRDFEQQLQMNGVKRTVVVDRLDLGAAGSR